MTIASFQPDITLEEEDCKRFISRLYPNLTQQELRICVLVRRGIRAEDIGEILHIAPATVYTHQKRIRHKLRLQRQQNLMLFLLRLQEK